MQKRRVLFNVKVAYDTPLSQLKLIPRALMEIIQKTDAVVYDRAHFAGFDDVGYLFEVVYYVLSSDYNKYMDIQQQMNFNIIEYLNSNDIKIAHKKCLLNA